LDLGYQFAQLCPYNHYARKNIGYLYALQQGAQIIYDTDDDNLPYDDWAVPEFVCDYLYSSNRKFVNIYNHFSNELIWPRGYPLDEIHQVAAAQAAQAAQVDPRSIGVWQGLADRDPDVDAIYRLIFPHEINFERKSSIFLEQGHYAPFNSQNTFWQRTAFHLLYLPATVSFRFTDILRGYIAQRLLWHQGDSLGFTAATVYQERNQHDLMRDFRDEVEGYLNIKEIVEQLDSLSFAGKPYENLAAVYQMLAEVGYVQPEELDLCQAWLADAQQNLCAELCS